MENFYRKGVFDLGGPTPIANPHADLELEAGRLALARSQAMAQQALAQQQFGLDRRAQSFAQAQAESDRALRERQIGLAAMEQDRRFALDQGQFGLAQRQSDFNYGSQGGGLTPGRPGTRGEIAGPSQGYIDRQMTQEDQRHRDALAEAGKGRGLEVWKAGFEAKREDDRFKAADTREERRQASELAKIGARSQADVQEREHARRVEEDLAAMPQIATLANEARQFVINGPRGPDGMPMSTRTIESLTDSTEDIQAIEQEVANYFQPQQAGDGVWMPTTVAQAEALEQKVREGVEDSFSRFYTSGRKSTPADQHKLEAARAAVSRFGAQAKARAREFESRRGDLERAVGQAAPGTSSAPATSAPGMQQGAGVPLNMLTASTTGRPGDPYPPMPPGANDPAGWRAVIDMQRQHLAAQGGGQVAAGVRPQPNDTHLAIGRTLPAQSANPGQIDLALLAGMDPADIAAFLQSQGLGQQATQSGPAEALLAKLYANGESLRRAQAEQVRMARAGRLVNHTPSGVRINAPATGAHSVRGAGWR